MTEQALVMFSIGPVQDFIAGARTARDLWTGSFILSHLARQAGTSFEQAGATLLYPATLPASSASDRFVASFPNKFSVRLEADRVATVAEAAHTVVRQEWRRIADSVRQHLKKHSGSNWDEGWQEQIDNLLECYWISLPMGEAVLGEANLRLESRKRLRDFAAYTGDRREKDTIDGLFEQMGPRDGGRTGSKQFWEGLREALLRQRSLAHLGENERLSAVNLTKRYAPEVVFRSDLGDLTAVVNSTSDVATAWWRQDITQRAKSNEPLKKAVDDYLKKLDEMLKLLPEAEGRGNGEQLEQIEGRYLYAEVLRELEASPNLKEAARTAVGRVREALKVLLKLSAETKSGPPPRYYALLFLDGDKMGRYISRQPVEKLKEVSGELLGYARRIRKEIAPKFGGTVIYTGGDDALLMLPVAKALDCAIELQKAFPLAPDTTVSMGLTLAHYKYPLQRALAEGRQTEKRAKGELDRDALAISVIKRSGEQVQTGSKWREIGAGELEVFPLIDELQGYFSQEWLSPKLPYRLRQETALLYSDGGGSGMKAQLVSEFRRLYGRQSNPPKDDAPAEESLKLLGQKLERLAGVMNFERFNDLMLVAAFLARGGEEE